VWCWSCVAVASSLYGRLLAFCKIPVHWSVAGRWLFRLPGLDFVSSFFFSVEVVFKTFLGEGRFVVGKGDVCVVNNSGVESVFLFWCQCLS